MKKALVTGGIGFIGFHLCERLILEGIEVIAIDKMPPRKREEQDEMAMRLGRNSLLTIVNENLETALLTKLVKDVDVVFHLAASTSIDCNWSKLAEVIKNNVNLTEKLIVALPKKSRFIYSSTVEVYGERFGEMTERTPTNPTSPYGITKLASESLIQIVCRSKEIPYIILRLPTVYGPWQREDMTYQQIISGVKSPEIDRSTIDVLYIEDIVDAFILAATTKEVNEIIHLSSGMHDAWYEGVRILNSDDHIFERNIHKTTLSTEKSERVLGFAAKTSLKDGLEKQCKHFTQWQQQKRQL